MAMYHFEYFSPTKIIFGKDTHKQAAALIKLQNHKKVLIHYGSNHAKKSGLLDCIKNSLKKEGISYIELGGVLPNPRLSLVYEGIDLCKKEEVDFILAVGGGSVIDSAKAIGYGVVNKEDVWEFFERKKVATACLPIGTILTIAAAGSEVSASSVITKEEGDMKRGYTNHLSCPTFSILNPDLTMTLPAYQTSCGCVDILMHTMERYFTAGGHLELTDTIAESLLKTVMTNASILHKDPSDYKARAEIMWAGSLSHNNLTSCGNDGNDFATHMLEHEVSGLFDVAHGAGLSAIWGSWARYVYLDCLPRFERFATHVMGIYDGSSSEEKAQKGIKAMEDFFVSIGMPTSLKELKLDPTDEELALMAKKCSIATNNAAGSAKILREEDMLEIYKMAKR